MAWARLASVLCLIAGAFASPLLFAQQLGGALTPEQVQQLEETRRRMEAPPYVPSNAPGCHRWVGRAFLSGTSDRDQACVGGCQVRLVDDDGQTARWEVTGERCARPAARRVERSPSPAAAPVGVGSKPEQERGTFRCVMVGAPGGGVRQVCGEGDR